MSMEIQNPQQNTEVDQFELAVREENIHFNPW